MSWLFSIPLRTVNNTKTQGNVSVCTGPKHAIAKRTDDVEFMFVWVYNLLLHFQQNPSKFNVGPFVWVLVYK